jgi:hypothetical protein
MCCGVDAPPDISQPSVSFFLVVCSQLRKKQNVYTPFLYFVRYAIAIDTLPPFKPETKDLEFLVPGD